MRARARVDEEPDLPNGYSLSWSGQYEYMERAKDKLTYILPLTLAIIALAGVAVETGVIMLVYLNQAWREIRAEKTGDCRRRS